MMDISRYAKPHSLHAPAIEAPSAELAPRHHRRAVDRQIAGMQRVFMETGGEVTGDQLVNRLRKRASQPISILARWIVARQVVNYSWCGQRMVPLFQFDLPGMTLLPCMAPILGELIDALDDWDVAEWFSTPNSWTDHVAPAEMVLRNPRAVLDAARCDRFLMLG